MTLKCPCCGGPIDRSAIEALRHVNVPRSQRRVLDALIKSYPKGRDATAIIEALYWDDANGGPLSADANVKVFVHRLRRSLPAYGWTIANRARGRSNAAVYSLERLA